MISPKDTVYVAGKVTGIEDIAIPMFFEAERFLLLKYGCKVLNPVRNNPGGTNWTQCMRHCVKLVERANIIVLLPTWDKESRGAQIEYDLALMHGHLILNLHELLEMRLAA